MTVDKTLTQFETLETKFRKRKMAEESMAAFDKDFNDEMKPFLETLGLPEKFTFLEAIKAAYVAGTKAISA